MSLASPWYLFVSILLISAQPTENDDQTVSRIYSDHGVPGQGLPSTLHTGDGPSLATGGSKIGVHTIRPRTENKGLRGRIVLVVISSIQKSKNPIYPYLQKSLSGYRLRTPHLRPRRSPTLLSLSHRFVVPETYPPRPPIEAGLRQTPMQVEPLPQ